MYDSTVMIGIRHLKKSDHYSYYTLILGVRHTPCPTVLPIELTRGTGTVTYI